MSLANTLTRARRQLIPRARNAALRVLPNTPVRRTIQGVEMTLPRRHMLPLMATDSSAYGRNLVSLGRALAADGDHLCALDVGANIGDSTLQLLDVAPDADVVCVEPDPEWLRYLHLNVDTHPRVAIEPSILLGPDADANLAIVHEDDGSSRLERTTAPATGAAITTDELRTRHPVLESVRLIKSDTDGYDVMLVPELARTFAASKPVIFFEFDPAQTRMAMPELDPQSVWPALAGLGYDRAVVWNNGGHLVGEYSFDDIEGAARLLDRTSPRERGYHFWDVAVAQAGDTVGSSALDSASGGSFR